MSRFLVITRRVALGCLPVVTLIALAPNGKAHAQFGAIFGGLTSTVTGIGTIIGNINGSLSTLQSLENTVVHPLSDLSNIQNNGRTIVNNYRGWMNTVYAVKTNSAQNASAQSLEGQWLSGVGSTSPNLQLGSAFTSTYGSRPTPTQALDVTMQAVDMGDASAQDAIQLSVMADSAATLSIQQANTLESEAMTTSAGSAPQIEATALAYEIGSMAVEHKLLASQLRATATRLAYEGADLKRGATVNGNGIQTIFGGLK